MHITRSVTVFLNEPIVNAVLATIKELKLQKVLKFYEKVIFKVFRKTTRVF